LLAGDLVINEVMFSNGKGLQDADGDQPDWIELHNTGTTAINLAGWRLTDDREELAKWFFPARELEPDEYLVVYASGKNRGTADPASELHANFELQADGEYVALVMPSGAISDSLEDVPAQRHDVSYGRSDEGLLYFTSPTPGEENGLGLLGLVADTRFSRDRGIYEAPIEVAIATSTPHAVIRYTTDGSAPSGTNGTIYTGPIVISQTTTLRAAAFASGYVSSNVDTQTYLFLADVLGQQGVPDGYPSQWSDYPADYDVDPEIVNSPQYGGQLLSSLASIPSLSLVLEASDLFGPSGIYQHPQQDGVDWERPVSAEWINPDGSEGFQVDAGLRIQGAASRDPAFSPKHSLRLLFKAEYGDGSLSFPVFGTEVDEFETLVLRAGYNNSWVHRESGQRRRALYIHDQFMRDTQLAMGRLSSSGSFVHLYINGMYWGLYNPVERPDANFAAAHLGGEEEDWDVIAAGSLVDGDIGAWAQLMSTVEQNLADGVTPYVSTPSGYALVQQWLDVESFADYMILNIYAGNLDWPFRNWYAARRRETGATFQFFSWDAERVMVDVNQDVTRANSPNSPGRIWAKLRSNPEFRLLVSDRLHEHLFNDGALSDSNALARFEALAAQVEPTVLGESARWGDYRRDVHPYQFGPYDLYTPQHWQTELNWLRDNYFPARRDIVLEQFRTPNSVASDPPYYAEPLYPSVAAPEFNQHGGLVTTEFLATLSGPAGATIYYTTDGSDPRLAGGSISPTAIAYSGGGIAIATNRVLKARAVGGGVWSALSQAEFLVHAPASAANITLSEIYYHPYEPTAAESAINANWDANDFEFVELHNTSAQSVDLTGVRFVEGISFDFSGSSLSVLPPDGRVVVVNRTSAFQARYGTGLPVAGTYSGKLDNSGEPLRLVDRDGRTIASVNYDDNGAWPGRADGVGYSLEWIGAGGDYNQPEHWRSSYEYGGSPGAAGSGPLWSIRINEVLSHSAGTEQDAIELYNPTAEDVPIGGWYLSDSSASLRKFRIPDGTVLGAYDYLVFDENQFNPTPATPAANHFALNGAEGDDVWLTAADSPGRLGHVDHVEFGPADDGVTLGPYTTSTGDVHFTALAGATLGGPNSGPRVGPVVISEILYSPLSGNDQFVELKNVSQQPVALYNPTFPLDTWRLTGGIDFVMPPGLVMQPGQTMLVVQIDPTLYRSIYSVPGDMLVVGPYDGTLNVSGESVRLRRPRNPVVTAEGTIVPYVVIDQVRYDDRNPWPSEAFGRNAALHRTEDSAYGDDPLNWQVRLSTGNPPRVAEVLLAKSSWSDEFLQQLQAAGFGEGGYSMPAGAAQLSPLPWGDLNQVKVRFSHDVLVDAGDLRIYGINRPAYSVAAFDYDSESFVATWTLTDPILPDKLLLDLDEEIQDTNGSPLDGNWINGVSAFPSGNGFVDTDDRFELRLNVVPGDVDRNQLVDRLDAAGVIAHLITGIGDRYDPLFDINADGRVSVTDVRLLMRNFPSTLPAGEPNPGAGSEPLEAVDSIFDRLGGGGVSASTTSFRSASTASEAIPPLPATSPTAPPSDASPLKTLQVVRRKGRTPVPEVVDRL